MDIKDVKYPSETVWARYVDIAGNTICIITSSEARSWYYLYDLADGMFIKRGKAKEPPELVEKYRVYERMGSREI